MMALDHQAYRYLLQHTTRELRGLTQSPEYLCHVLTFCVNLYVGTQFGLQVIDQVLKLVSLKYGMKCQTEYSCQLVRAFSIMNVYLKIETLKIQLKVLACSLFKHYSVWKKLCGNVYLLPHFYFHRTVKSTKFLKGLINLKIKIANRTNHSKVNKLNLHSIPNLYLFQQ